METTYAGRPFLWATHHCAALATYPKVLARRAGTRPTDVASSPQEEEPATTAGLPSYLVLLRVGFAMPAPLLERRCALTAPFHPYLGVAVRAVCFLWHFPSADLETSFPDVIRHTTLRSSDFPPAASRKDAASDRPAQLPTLIVYAAQQRQRLRALSFEL
jgi:hypothetical protein